MCNYDNSIDETDDWIIFSMDRLNNAKIVSGSYSKSAQVWESTVGCSDSALTMETRSIQGGTKIILNTTQNTGLIL